VPCTLLAPSTSDQMPQLAASFVVVLMPWEDAVMFLTGVRIGFEWREPHQGECAERCREV
jgi:hypothetical protein